MYSVCTRLTQLYLLVEYKVFSTFYFIFTLLYLDYSHLILFV